METYSQTLAYMNEVNMNDRVKMTVSTKPLAIYRSRGRSLRTDKSCANKTKDERIVHREEFLV